MQIIRSLAVAGLSLLLGLQTIIAGPDAKISGDEQLVDAELVLINLPSDNSDSGARLPGQFHYQYEYWYNDLIRILEGNDHWHPMVTPQIPADDANNPKSGDERHSTLKKLGMRYEHGKWGFFVWTKDRMHIQVKVKRSDLAMIQSWKAKTLSSKDLNKKISSVKLVLNDRLQNALRQIKSFNGSVAAGHSVYSFQNSGIGARLPTVDSEMGASGHWDIWRQTASARVFYLNLPFAAFEAIDEIRAITPSEDLPLSRSERCRMWIKLIP